MEKSITYFEERGRHNTEQVLALVRARAAELGIRIVVVATTSGDTGMLAIDQLPGLDVVVVTHSTGFAAPGQQEVPADCIRHIENKGGRVLTTTHAFGGVGRSVRRKFGTWQTEEIIAQTLKRFGQGVKVAVEIAMMAADAGLVTVQEEIISCGGTGHGLDTALVLNPANAQDFFEVEVLEVICKPRVP
jgi:uncharacterized protein